jgi:hypothetical protein
VRQDSPRVPVDLGAERVQRVDHLLAESFARNPPINSLLFGELSGETQTGD